jgi:hypothetical protein
MRVCSGRSPARAFGDQHPPVGVDEGTGGDDEQLHARDLR